MIRLFSRNFASKAISGNNVATIDSLVSMCKRRGFIFPSCEAYNGLSGAFDYGPLGSTLKRKISETWWNEFVAQQPNCYGVDTPIILNPKVWQVSGHVDHFADTEVDCKFCKNATRTDKLIDGWNLKNPSRAVKIADDDVAGANEFIRANAEKLRCSHCQRNDCFEPNASKKNLMFQTHVGSKAGGVHTYLRPETAQGIFQTYKNVVQTMRVRLPFGIGQIGRAFRNECSTSHFIFRMREFEQLELEYFCSKQDVAKSLAYWRQTTQSFLTERLSLQPNRIRFAWHRAASSTAPKLPDQRYIDCAHYAGDGGFDVEFQFSFGWSELCGIANRGSALTHNRIIGTHDTKLHQLELSEIDGGDGLGSVPHVVEPSFGLDRLTLAVLENAWKPAKSLPAWRATQVTMPTTTTKRSTTVIQLEWFVVMRTCTIWRANSIQRDSDDDGGDAAQRRRRPVVGTRAADDAESIRDVLALPPSLAPYQLAVLPLVTKPELNDFAWNLFGSLRKSLRVDYDESGSIGRRYRRHDEIGTPVCATIDFQTLQDNTVTLRHRDSMLQERCAVNEIGFLSSVFISLRIIMMLMRLLSQQVALDDVVLVLPPFCRSGDVVLNYGDYFDVQHLSTTALRGMRIVDFRNLSIEYERKHRRAFEIDTATHLHLRSEIQNYSPFHFKPFECDDVARVHLSQFCTGASQPTVKQFNCYDVFCDMVDERLLEEVQRQIVALRRSQPLTNQCTTTATVNGDNDDKILTLLRIEALLWGNEWETKLFWDAFDSMRATSTIRQLASDVQTQFFLASNNAVPATTVAADRQHLNQNQQQHEHRRRHCDDNNNNDNHRHCIVPLLERARQQRRRCNRFALSIHWRGGDFFVSHSTVTPTARQLADYLLALSLRDDECVFLMTNADDDSLNALSHELLTTAISNENDVPTIVMLIDSRPDDRLHSMAHGPLDPLFLLLQMEIAFNATEFVGTEYSTVSMWIQKEIFVEHLHNLAKIASIRKQKMISIVYYAAMKKLKDSDVPINSLADLSSVKGIGPFVLRNVEKRELARLGLAPPPDPKKKAAAAKRRQLKKLAKDASSTTSVEEQQQGESETAADEQTSTTTSGRTSSKSSTAESTLIVSKTTSTSRRAAPTLLVTATVSINRRKAIEKAQALLEQRPLFVDVETTGMSKVDEIVEVAILDVDGKVLLDSLVRPRDVGVSRKAKSIHGIDDSQLDKAPLWSRLWNTEIRSLLSSSSSSSLSPLGAYNATFDRRMLLQLTTAPDDVELLRLSRWFCIMQLFRRQAPPSAASSTKTKYALSDAVQQAKIVTTTTNDVSHQLHRARYDADCARRLFIWIANGCS